MANHQGPTYGGKTGHGKRTSINLPSALHTGVPPILPDVKKGGGAATADRRRSHRSNNGDCSRWRRFADPVRQRYYAQHRQQRFARRMLGKAPAS
jgi:hypothetical protein